MSCEIIDEYFNENGKIHRDVGPAIIHSTGRNEHYQDGNLHRLDGPAIYYSNDSNGLFNQWWFQNKKINCSSQIEFEKYLKLKSFW